jgi:hypothetical protein
MSSEDSYDNYMLYLAIDINYYHLIDILYY